MAIATTMNRRRVSSLAVLIGFLISVWTNNEVACFAVGSNLPRSYARQVLNSREASLSIRQKSSLLWDSPTTSEGDAPETDEVQFLRGGGTKATDVGIWPSNDALDKQLMKIAVPCIANFAIAPMVGAVDLFWVNQMRNPLAIAGQAAANSVFNSVYWLASFLPSGTSFFDCELTKNFVHGVSLHK